MDNRIVKKIFGEKVSVGTRCVETRLKWLEAALLKVPKGSRILDAGAGELDQKKFCGHLDYVSQDFGQYDGGGDGKGYQTTNWDNSKLDIVCDIVDIPEPDASFDAIMCIEVFEHLPNPVAAIKEFSRLLKTDGTLIITAPFWSLTHFAPYHFCTGFNHYFYERNLVDHGFEIVEITPNGNYFEFIAQELLRISQIANDYTDSSISATDKAAILKLLLKLGELSKKDKGSHEVLCFGYHVFARRTAKR
ncbi:MAG: class I SAM-dependent methyltransferase [Flavobacteriales bacterium]|nr:class I SAM-dependent methyltransferase [Flavobacteriales bacterium]